jgi:hypothetical protein
LEYLDLKGLRAVRNKLAELVKALTKKLKDGQFGYSKQETPMSQVVDQDTQHREFFKLLKKPESFKSRFESFQKLPRPIFCYVMTCAQNNKDWVILAGNFWTGKAAEWHLSFLERNAHQIPPFLRCTFEEYWKSLSKEFTDFMNLANTCTEMIGLKMQGTNITAYVDCYRTLNLRISIDPCLMISWFLDRLPYDLLLC